MSVEPSNLPPHITYMYRMNVDSRIYIYVCIEYTVQEIIRQSHSKSCAHLMTNSEQYATCVYDGGCPGKFFVYKYVSVSTNSGFEN